MYVRTTGRSSAGNVPRNSRTSMFSGRVTPGFEKTSLRYRSVNPLPRNAERSSLRRCTRRRAGVTHEVPVTTRRVVGMRLLHGWLEGRADR
ncbi:hypothetical protein GCM10009717_38370 [Agromyces allii]|uniref:Uncharacterized protein n=1 Tax=Agromyces allii TaxID=393607 RepID=A0ABP5CRK5_9MICO